jgi:hypothetical protein
LSARPTIKIATYHGSAVDALASFRAESKEMAEEGYYPISQCWMPGEYSVGFVVVAMLLCLITIGFVLVLWMLLVKPRGTLIVSYQLDPNAVDSPKSPPIEAEDKM